MERAQLALSQVQSSVDPNLQRTVDVNRLNLERLQAQLSRAQIIAPYLDHPLPGRYLQECTRSKPVVRPNPALAK